MNIQTQWICPKCNTINVTLAESDQFSGEKIEYCDIEVGGCDERFVVETRRIIEVSAIFSLVEESKK